MIQQCTEVGAYNEDMDQVARDAINKKRQGYSVKSCEWEGSPKYIGAGCGNFCTGMAFCRYKVGNHVREPVKRLIACRGSKVGDTVNCGNATDCHKEIITFKAAVGEVSAPVQQPPAGENGAAGAQ